MSDSKLYPVSATHPGRTHLNRAQYETLYAESIDSPHTFWPRMATTFLDWLAPFTQLNDCNMAAGSVRWFIGGKVDHIPATIFANYPKLMHVHDAVRDHPGVKSWYAKG